MPDIVVCFKWVVDEAYIRKGPSGELDLTSVDYKIGEYDRNAIEEAVRLRESLGGTVTAVTVGGPDAAKGVKDALSRGPDQACFICDYSFRDLEPSQTAALLAEAIRTRQICDLIVCGEGSSDLYAQQVGPRLAERLGFPCISFVRKLSIEDGRLLAERKVDDGIEVTESPLPAVVTVLPEINTPRIPGVKDTLMASKKPAVKLKKEELPPLPEPLLKTIGLKAARMERSCEQFGSDEAEIGRFLEALKKKGILS
jgi:electron transfer flavoprotein beta subunit